MVLEGYFYCCSLVGADICKDIGFIVGISLERGWVALSAIMEKVLLQPSCLECLVQCGGFEHLTSGLTLSFNPPI